MISLQPDCVELALCCAESAADTSVDVYCCSAALETSVSFCSDLNFCEWLSEIVPCLGRIAVSVTRLLSWHVVIALNQDIVSVELDDLSEVTAYSQSVSALILVYVSVQ